MSPQTWNFLKIAHIFIFYFLTLTPFFRVLIDDVQAAMDGQSDSGPAVKSHSYTKYNTWPTVRSLGDRLDNRSLLVVCPP